MTASLDNRTVLVTGASRGLGRAMALGLLSQGASVALASTAPSKQLDETLKRAAALAPAAKFRAFFGDLRRPGDCDRIAREASEALGPIDVLVNNAAIPNNGEGEPFWRIETEDWLKVSHTNTDTIFFMSRAVGAAMVARGSGKIINISTSDRTMVRGRFTPYGPSKAFVEACSRAWSQELSGTGVTLNVLSPGGVVDTLVDVTGVAATGKSFLPAEVMVAPLLWLSSSLSDGVNGQRFVANLWNESLPLDERISAARQSSGETPRIM